MLMLLVRVFAYGPVLVCALTNVLPTGSKEREVLGVESNPVAILPSCLDMKTTSLLWYKQGYSWGVKIRNTTETVLMSQYSPRKKKTAE